MSDEIEHKPIMGGAYVLDTSDWNEIYVKPPTSLCLHSADGKVAVEIHFDGRITLGEGVAPDYAAKVFWNAVQTLRCRPPLFPEVAQ